MSDSALVEPSLVQVPVASVATIAQQPPRRGWLLWSAFIIVLFAVLGALFIVGELPRRRQAALLVGATKDRIEAPVRVRLGTPKPAPVSDSLRLPATVEAARATGVYARVGGYVVRRLVEIGQTVEAGQVLAEIDAIDAVQQLAREEGVLAENRAALVRAGVVRDQARLDQDRSQKLGAEVISRQAIERTTSALAAAEAETTAAQARIEAQEAEVRRLRQQASFAKVIAPFAGVITGRTVEVGNLIPPGGGGTPLFQIAQLEPLRVVVEVPQSAIAGLEPGLTAGIANGPGKPQATGTVARVARVLDPAKRSMRVEIELPLGTKVFAPGMFVQAVLEVPQQRLLQISAEALLISGKGTQVAVVDAEDRVRLRQVTVVRDTGPDVLVSEGLTAKDRVVLNPGGTIADGTRVVEVVAKPASSEGKPTTSGEGKGGPKSAAPGEGKGESKVEPKPPVPGDGSREGAAATGKPDAAK